MNFFKKLFGDTSMVKKGSAEVVPLSSNNSRFVYDQITLPCVAGSNYIELFKSIPEVFFPIDYIASRIANANYNLKKVKDDSIVWRNKQVNNILTQPNCMMNWHEFVYQHFVYKLCTGNSYIRAAMSDSFSKAEKWRYCSNFWVLPSGYVDANINYHNMPLFGIAEKDEIITDYRLSFGLQGLTKIPTYQIWHDRDGGISFDSNMFMKAESRLKSQRKPMSNLIAVYEARNVIYVKRGGLGFIVGQNTDAGGTVPLTEKEKDEILQQYYGKYGLGERKYPIGISSVPLGFIRTNLSISELQPFDETLYDAITIAGAFGIPSVLVPRKDQSTFSNQANAEKSVYSSTVIPMAKQFCKEFTAFLGLEDSDLYIDCSFDNVDCLQRGMKEMEEVKTISNTRCREQFECGLITLNDWRAQIGESKVENDLFDKLKFDMSDDELDKVNQVFNTKSAEDGRESQKPTVQNEGK